MRLSSEAMGNLAMIFYTLMTALSSIFIHETTHVMTPLLSAFNTFLFCLLIYSALSLGTFKKVITIKSNFLSIFMLNVTTAICWIFTFLSLQCIPPELYLFVYLCAMPIFSTVLYRHKIGKAVLLFFGLLILIYTYHDSTLYYGIVLAFIGGASGTVYSIYSKRVSQHFSTAEILSLRFYLVVIVTFILCLTLGKWMPMTTMDYSQLALLSLISVIIPLTLFQIGLKNLTLTNALSYLPLSPLLCYFINLIIGNKSFDISQFCVIIFICIILFL